MDIHRRYLATCMAYIDLNPIHIEMTKTPGAIKKMGERLMLSKFRNHCSLNRFSPS